MAREIKKKDRICIVCGKPFKGIASAQTCTPACRIDLVRLKEAGKRPEFLLMAKGKGQKIPDLNAPKRIKYAKGEKAAEKLIAEITSEPKFNEAAKKAFNDLLTLGRAKIQYAESTPESFDGGRVDRAVMDEVGCMPPPMTKEQIWTHNAEINKQIEEETKRDCPLTAHPKTFKLMQEVKIDELKKLLK